MLLTGPFGGPTDDVREFLLCLADQGLPLTGWGDLDPASRRTVRERLAGRLTEAEGGVLRLTSLGREFLDLPARMSPSPAWFSLTGTTPALLAAAMSGPEPPATLAAATAN